MKIIILGAGQVGGTLADRLADENNDVTVVDINNDRLRELQDRLDIRTIQGMGSMPGVLGRAGAEDADLLVAVTASDEVNMLACQIACTLYKTPTKIARIRSRSYTNHKNLFENSAIPVDVIISPEQLVTKHIEKLVKHPGALQVLDFADGKVQLVAVRAYQGSDIIGKQLSEVRKRMPKVDTRIAAIFRRGSPIMPKGATVIEADDEVFFISAKKHSKTVIHELRGYDNKYKRITIAGGGNIGARLAQAIENDYRVKVIEQNYDRCRSLSELLSKAIVLHGSASDHDLLTAENIDATDVFIALTNDDEANIMSSLLAKKMGAYKVITLITNPAYVDLVQGGTIDIALSPQQVTIGSLLTHVRRGDISNVHSLRRGAAEAIELIAHGDTSSSKVVGRRLDELKFPEGVTVGAVVRGSEVLIAHREIVVESDDHVVLFLIDKSKIKDVEKMFQVGFSFF